ncbi:hypothetical protein ACIRCZ_11850 [Leifsonia sp. NPDC102414]|uniref:ParB family protein n=1 Tax=Leifsonia sp. NPDC102414 TaxID=3364124 RepID=UPI003805C426
MENSTKRITLAFYVSAELRARARAAYRATGGLEGDPSWSGMLQKALLAEVERREGAHNRGDPYDPVDDAPLPPGRPKI